MISIFFFAPGHFRLFLHGNRVLMIRNRSYTILVRKDGLSTCPTTLVTLQDTLSPRLLSTVSYSQDNQQVPKTIVPQHLLRKLGKSNIFIFVCRPPIIISELIDKMEISTPSGRLPRSSECL